ncbi:MAG: hypothetical protein ACRDRJ_11145 [Streptosporangiaceae bacterium]
METLMLGCSFSKPAIAAFDAVPSDPRPAVAHTIVCLALAGTCEPPAVVAVPLVLPQAASPITAAAPAVMAASAVLFFGHIFKCGHLLFVVNNLVRE